MGDKTEKASSWNRALWQLLVERPSISGTASGAEVCRSSSIRKGDAVWYISMVILS
jgi:hypothetical protein